MSIQTRRFRYGETKPQGHPQAYRRRPSRASRHQQQSRHAHDPCGGLWNRRVLEVRLDGDGPIRIREERGGSDRTRITRSTASLVDRNNPLPFGLFGLTAVSASGESCGMSSGRSRFRFRDLLTAEVRTSPFAPVNQLVSGDRLTGGLLNRASFAGWLIISSPASSITSALP